MNYFLLCRLFSYRLDFKEGFFNVDRKTDSVIFILMGREHLRVVAAIAPHSMIRKRTSTLEGYHIFNVMLVRSLLSDFLCD